MIPPVWGGLPMRRCDYPPQEGLRVCVGGCMNEEVFQMARKRRLGVRALVNLDQLGEEFGDAYCYTALERNTKLLLAWHLGKRSVNDTWHFARKLKNATGGRFQLTTDGYTPYRTEMPCALGGRIDFAQLIKIFGPVKGNEAAVRYSPGNIMGTDVKVIAGNPDKDHICTSHAERHNLTIRMQMRRLTRLTNGFSKKWENHEAALALFFAYYSFFRVHSTIKTTPAVKARLTDHVWNVKELLEAVATEY